LQAIGIAAATAGIEGEQRIAVLTDKESTMNRLESISTRQRSSRLRDVVFAALIVLAGSVALGSVRTAVHAADVHGNHVAHR
jgi:hypothetical protein